MGVMPFRLRPRPVRLLFAQSETHFAATQFQAGTRAPNRYNRKPVTLAKNKAEQIGFHLRVVCAGGENRLLSLVSLLV